MGDLGQVVSVEQAHLQRAVIGGEFGDGGGAQRGDPLEIGCGVGLSLSSRSVSIRAAVIMPRLPTSTSLVARTGGHHLTMW